MTFTPAAVPVVPVLVATDAPTPWNEPVLLWHGVSPVQRANANTLADLLAELAEVIRPPATPLDPLAWEAAPYRPVPNIVEAATLLYARHGVAEIAAARADATNLTRTTAAIRAVVEEARQLGQHRVVFVTGIPGAGKTLCGLDTVFGASRDLGAAFLTGNAPLVAVLREALALDASRGGAPIREARRRTVAALQNVHRFLEHHVLSPAEIPDVRVVVFDEAQRAWDAAKATQDTQNRRSRLTDSEPAHMLEIMGRHPDWAVVVALVGSGQEINTGEAGLTEWGRVIAGSQGRWRASVAPAAVGEGPVAQRLAPVLAPWLALDPALHLDVPIRSVRSNLMAPWVDAVLSGDAAAARNLTASGEVPVYLTRDLSALRTALRHLARGERRAGLVASSGNRRLRAEGLGGELRGDAEVVSWFLRRWPDIRASEALEVPATEYSCQGLELDLVGLAWGGDFLRIHGRWQVRSLSGSRWNTVTRAAEVEFTRNTYRVLLTRARYETVIWVPPGSDEDATRSRAEMDAVAAFLEDCGARALPLPSRATPALLPALL
ncbi:DUF2075 domain-containing protein [Roseomonas elaeocarpi]|uniref:DUF2075 domain-containing protein n=1 Tax=Roseomonas elaeocarpi TaxID=907779 RepID=A0ABV6JWY3_9PROT